MKRIKLEGYQVYRSEHYLFCCKPDSYAAGEMEKIMRIQEESYARIVRFLGVEPDFPIRYVLCENSEDVGRAYGDNEPCNGFAELPDTVFAVYSERVQCIGPHEDTHLIAALRARPDSVFLREGLAMYMDQTWWGRPNAVWTREFLCSGRYVSIEKLLDNDSFWENPDEITYPLAGAFTLWMIRQLGRQRYLEAVYVTGNQACGAIENAFGMPVAQVEQLFCGWVVQQAEV